MRKREGRYIFEYTDGDEHKCYTCQFRKFRGIDNRTAFCIIKQKVLDYFDPEQGCKNSWERRYKRVY
jgi:hypothetical protein